MSRVDLGVRTVGLGRARLVVHRRAVVVATSLLVALVMVGVCSLTTGAYSIPVPDVVRTLAGHGSSADTFIVNTLRLPRMLVGAMVGAALGLSGALFQTLTRNPLGSPDIIGFTLGAATGGLVELLVVGGGVLAVGAGSILGGVVTAAAIYLLAYRDGVQGDRLVLVGVGVSAILLSVNAYLILRARLTDAMAAAAWLVGSLNGRDWTQVLPLAIALGVLVPAALVLQRRLNLLEMGDDHAAQLGVPVEATRIAVVLVAVALTAVAIAACGPIAFVALAAPQLAKRLTRRPGANLVASGLMGAVLLTASDFASQRLFTSATLPVGVTTGAIGGLYLAGMLAWSWRRGRT